MSSSQLTFDKLAYIDRLKTGGVDEAKARAHAEALDAALRETVATRQDLRDEVGRVENRIEIAVRDLTIRAGGIAMVLFGALAAIKYFG
jgi:hypothetical protein